MKATKISAYRRDTGLTRMQLAARLGVVPRTVWCWETARSEPTRRHMLQLAAMMGRYYNAHPQIVPQPVTPQITDKDYDQGTSLRIMRLAHGFGLTEFSELFGVTPAIVTRWETGEYTMSTQTVQTIERFFGKALTKSDRRDA